MRRTGLSVLVLALGSLLSLISIAHALEEGELVRRDGQWQYLSSDDPGLKYLLLKGIISQEEYEKGRMVLETKQRLQQPTFRIDVNNGLNVRVGDKFFLKLRLLTQVRYTYHDYNQAWGLVRDSRTQIEVLGGQVEFRGVKRQSDTSDFSVRRTRLQFLGYAFAPNIRYNVTLA